MLKDEVPEGSTMRSIPERRTLAEVRYQAAARRAKRSKRSQRIGAVLTGLFLLGVGISALAVLAILVGVGYWALTGEPIFGG